MSIGNRTFGRSFAQQGSNLNLNFTSASAFSAAENQTAVGTVIANPSGCSYSIVAGGDGASFAINSATGVLTFQSAPNYEVKNSYSVTVRATKGSVTKDQTITVTITDVLEAPSAVSSSFDVDTISGIVTITDDSVTSQYEIYAATNGGAETLIGTTVAGVKVYTDATCKQNSSVVYRVRSKNGSNYSGYVAASALATPLCWKTDQSTLTAHIINTLNITATKSVTVNYSDGTSQSYSGNNANITKNFAATGQYNVWLTGDINFITNFQIYSQLKVKGDLTNWKLPPSGQIYIHNCNFTGSTTALEISSTTDYIYLFGNQFTGLPPTIALNNSIGLTYRVDNLRYSDSNNTVFRKAMTVFNISNQNVSFPTVNINKLLKSIADWYQSNAPTANCTFTMNGANMGIPTGGASNADIARIIEYYTAAGKTATIVVRTS